MGARAEGLPWERQPREGEEAYSAFLAYRDLAILLRMATPARSRSPPGSIACRHGV